MRQEGRRAGGRLGSGWFQQEIGGPLEGLWTWGPEISCEHLGARCMRVRDLGVPQLVMTPNGTQTVHLPLGFFRPQFLLQINRSSFLQAWLDPSVSSRGCPTHALSTQDTVAWLRHRPRGWPSLRQRLQVQEEIVMPGPPPEHLLPAGPVPRASRAVSRGTLQQLAGAVPLSSHLEGIQP